MRLRTRLLLALAAVLFVAFGSFLWWTEVELSSDLNDYMRQELEREARLTAAAIGNRTFSDTLADRLGAAADLRVTLIAPGGSVAGDSEVPRAEIPDVENHGDRPEVRAALEGRTGAATRTSETVTRSLLYVAIPHPEGVVRLAVPRTEVREVLSRARRLILVGGGLSLVLGLALVGALSRFVVRPLRRMRNAARAIAGGDLSRRVRPTEGGELGALGHSIDEMAARLERLLADLRSEKEDLDALFESMEDGVAVIDGGGRLARANPAFARWVGSEDPSGRRLATLVRNPELVDAVERGIGGASESRELALGERTALLSVQPHRGGALIVLRDLTRLRKLEGVRRDFVANVSHELKTPLTSMTGFAEAIADGDLPAERRREFAGRILANAGRMRRLVDDLLDLSRVESGSWEPSPEALAPGDVARIVWSSLAPLPEQREVRLRVDAGGLRVSADRDALRQILRNLFDNALRYAPEGTEVGMRAHPTHEGRVRLEVSDAGPGIPTEHLSRVFERFFRVDPARSREDGGTGLGLSIVKHLVLAHGGEVGADSELGRGTTLWFTLPAAEASGAARPARGR